jgi:hypothetical protein
MSTETESTCFRCGERKPADAFYADKSKASGRKSICKACDRAKARDYYAENAQRVIARVVANRGMVPPQQKRPRGGRTPGGTAPQV